MAQRTKCFLVFLYYLSFCVISDFKNDFLLVIGLDVLCSFISFSMFVCGMLVMIGHVREIRHMY